MEVVAQLAPNAQLGIAHLAFSKDGARLLAVGAAPDYTATLWRRAGNVGGGGGGGGNGGGGGGGGGGGEDWHAEMVATVGPEFVGVGASFYPVEPGKYARHVIGCQLTQETMVQNTLDDVALVLADILATSLDAS